MGGQTGGRGYLIQAVISVLDALTDDHDWISVVLEPNLTSDKIDILWQYPKRQKVVQVKSSQNQISVPDVKEWAEDLEKSYVADEYEIRLIGPVSDGVPKMGAHGNVKVPVPEFLNLTALLYRAAHHLDRYLHAQKLPAKSPSAREMMVGALVTKLSTFATEGKPVKRTDFDALLRSWISDPAASTPQPLLPNAVTLGVQEKLQEAIWQSRTKAFHELQAMASDLIDSVSPHAEDWSEACDDMATGFDSTLPRLKQVFDRDGQFLSKSVREHVSDAIGLCHDGHKEVDYSEGPPEVSLRGREIAGRLYEVLKQVCDISAEEIRKAAGVGDG